SGPAAPPAATGTTPPPARRARPAPLARARSAAGPPSARKSRGPWPPSSPRLVQAGVGPWGQAYRRAFPRATPNSGDLRHLIRGGRTPSLQPARVSGKLPATTTPFRRDLHAHPGARADPFDSSLDCPLRRVV